MTSQVFKDFNLPQLTPTGVYVQNSYVQEMKKKSPWVRQQLESILALK